MHAKSSDRMNNRLLSQRKLKVKDQEEYDNFMIWPEEPGKKSTDNAFFDKEDLSCISVYFICRQRYY